MDNVILKDPKMDEMIQDIIEIFNLPGVELVRLSGITKRVQRIIGINSMDEYTMDNILHKMRNAGVINWKYTMKCPHCGELSYQIIERDINKPKLCDTCNTMYTLIGNIDIEG